MTWWTSEKITPKTKFRFIVGIGSGGVFGLPNVKSITKPSVEVSSKEYRLINHTFNYPGLVKWQPITITFVDMNGEGSAFDTAQLFQKMLTNTGYANPTSTSSITVPEKASSIDNSFGTGIDASVASGANTGAVVISQINPDGEVVEQWTLKNPMIKSVKMGDLSYDADDLVEYSIDVIYDWAEISDGEGSKINIGSAYTAVT